MTISKRPYEVNNAFDKYRFSPFVSTVTTNLNPIGLPPVRRDYNLEVEKKIKPESILFSKNRSILKKIEKLKKLEKEVYIENLRKTQQKTDKLREISLRKNKEILKIRKDNEKLNNNQSQSVPLLLCKSGKTITKLPDIELKEKINSQICDENIKNTNINELNDNLKYQNNVHQNQNHTNDLNEILKNDPKYIKMKNKLKVREEENVKDLVNFAKSLDFDKYMQELEIKEALNLIKIKVNEEVEQERLDEEIKHLIENQDNNDNNTGSKLELDLENKIEEENKNKANLNVNENNDNALNNVSF